MIFDTIIGVYKIAGGCSGKTKNFFTRLSAVSAAGHLLCELVFRTCSDLFIQLHRKRRLDCSRILSISKRILARLCSSSNLKDQLFIGEILCVNLLCGS